ncbi:DUF805 domain-containing protein [Pseudooceanicola aestuarii]|uniref:DUF805 domain-containing protein n=1 Tax=Pseudooceanicola aestuarii TaxID=2697319 RepID=UPI0013D1E435|nr:DUF805 domain-containing protein [Pseudooceanicola aestuarii]
MGFTDAIRTCFRNYVTFSGRASRPEYWWFVLFVILGGIVAGILDGIVFGAASVDTGPGAISAQSNGPLAALFSLATLLPGLSAAWRRMHDSGRSGLFVLYPLIAFFGVMSFGAMFGGIDMMSGDIGAAFSGLFGIVFAVAVFIAVISPLLVIWWLTRPSQPGPNTWGPNPHEVSR